MFYSFLNQIRSFGDFFIFFEISRVQGTDFVVITETDELVELSFTRSWDLSLEGKSVPLNIDKRFEFLHSTKIFIEHDGM